MGLCRQLELLWRLWAESPPAMQKIGVQPVQESLEEMAAFQYSLQMPWRGA